MRGVLTFLLLAWLGLAWFGLGIEFRLTLTLSIYLIPVLDHLRRAPDYDQQSPYSSREGCGATTEEGLATTDRFTRLP